MVGDNVQGAPWDLHGDNYGRSSKKLKLKEFRSPEPSSSACSQAKPNTAHEPHGTSPQAPDSRISITSSTRSFSLGRPMNGGRKSISQTSTRHGRVLEFHNVERMMSASGMRPQRTKRQATSGSREAESRNEPSNGASDSPLVAPTVIQIDEVALVGSSTSAASKEPYRGTANRTRLSFQERRSSLPQTDKKGNRLFRRNSTFSNHAKPGEAVDSSRERVMQTSPDVVDLDKMPQSGLSIDHTPQSVIRRKVPSPTVETPASLGSQADSESLVELESPDPIQELMSVALSPSIAPSKGQTSTHRAAVAKHRANTSVSVVPRQNRIFEDCHADITRTNFTRSGRDQPVSAATKCGPSLSEVHEDMSWPICLVRNGPNTQTMAGLMLEFHTQPQTLSPSLGGCDLSETEPGYASTIGDVFLVTYDYEAFRLQLGRRNRHGTRLEDKNVDFEFTSAKDIQEVVNLLSNKRISCVTKSR